MANKRFSILSFGYWIDEKIRGMRRAVVVILVPLVWFWCAVVAVSVVYAAQSNLILRESSTPFPTPLTTRSASSVNGLALHSDGTLFASVVRGVRLPHPFTFEPSVGMSIVAVTCECMCVNEG